MKQARSKNQRWRNKGALELVEESVHLLRMAPLGFLFSYYTGSLPFVLGLLFFWADMSRSAFAGRHCARAAFFLALLYLWMKCWQAVYAGQLRARVAGSEPVRWSVSRVARMLATQSIVQPTCMVVLPISFLITLPFGWVYAFYQNLSVTGDGGEENVRESVRKASRQASLFAGQNHLLIVILFSFGVVIFMNLTLALFMLPHLLKMFSGVENLFTRSGMNMLNSTFFAVTGGLTYLCVNPLIKAAYVLRCFYGESLQTGADLRSDLGRFARAPRTLVAALAIFVMMSVCAMADDPAGGTPPANVEAGELDRSIREVIDRPEYTWRLPREKLPEDDVERGFVGKFMDDALNTIKELLRPIKVWIKDTLAWIEDWMKRHSPDPQPHERGSWDWHFTAQALIFALLALVASILAILLLRMWRRRRMSSPEVVGRAVAAAPDLTKEDVQADELPSDEWLALARELLAKGELRLALRAFYLSTLAGLAQREIITLARFKSNRDYEGEVKRRAHSQPEVIEAFAQNMTVFESAWYGMHEVTREAVEHFITNHERIQTHAS